MDKTLRRDSAPFHVTAAKNFASRAEGAGLKRMDLLESYARRHGSPDWNTFNAKGQVSLSLRGMNGEAMPVTERFAPAQVGVFREAMLSMVEAAAREGMTCRRTGPIILTDERGLGHYPDLAQVGGIVLSRRPGPGRMRIYRNLDAWTIVRAAEEAITGYTGLIVVDAIEASSKAFHDALRRMAPAAYILAPCAGRAEGDSPSFRRDTFGQGLAYGDGFRLLEPPVTRKLEEGLWSGRLFQLLEWLSESSQDLDPANLPGIDDLDSTDPVLLKLLRTIPGYDATRPVQNMKSQEQFRSILTPLQR